MSQCTWTWDKPKHIHHACKLDKGHDGAHQCKWCEAVYR